MKELENILNKHHDALKASHLVYPTLKRLKTLRNRIHLQKAEYSTDHDYNAFDIGIKQEIGQV